MVGNCPQKYGIQAELDACTAALAPKALHEACLYTSAGQTLSSLALSLQGAEPKLNDPVWKSHLNRSADLGAGGPGQPSKPPVANRRRQPVECGARAAAQAPLDAEQEPPSPSTLILLSYQRFVMQPELHGRNTMLPSQTGDAR